MFKRPKSVDRNLCFIIMPFRDELKAVYNKIEEVITRDHNMKCLRADNIYTTGIIIQEIWTKICEAQIIIADATGKNTNVFYEMGLAHAIDKDIIILTQSMDYIPFDLQHRGILKYDINKLDDLTDSLSKHIEKMKWRPPEINQWINTDKPELRIGISYPTDGVVVRETPIKASGRIVGLSANDLSFYIQGFIITDKEHPQGSGWIEKNGYWKINDINLGATKHMLFFKLFDESDKQVAKSRSISIIKRVKV